MGDGGGDTEDKRGSSSGVCVGRTPAEIPTVEANDGDWEDFTCVTSWEDLVRSLEDVLRSWNACDTGPSSCAAYFIAYVFLVSVRARP